MSQKAARLYPKEHRMYRGTFALVIFAETMVFVTVFASRFLYTGTGHPIGIGVLPVAILLAFLLAGLATRQGLAQLRAGEVAASVRAQGWGVVLGLGAVLLLVADLATVGLPSTEPYASHYYLGEALHLLHALAGWIALLAIWSKTRRGGVTQANPWVLEAALLFWGFVSLVWLSFLVVFLVL